MISHFSKRVSLDKSDHVVFACSMVSEGHISLLRVNVQNRWTVLSCIAATLALALEDDLLGLGFEPLALGKLEDFFSSSSLFFFWQLVMSCPFLLQ